jgi:prepilin-type N-terminal cleavage/methylation domain-containing protein
MNRAFTLIELLVVIAILAALMAVGLPVMRHARERGAEAVCQSNLRQMSLILKTYTADQDGLFPVAQYIYQSKESVAKDEWAAAYDPYCRWHDGRIGVDGPLLGQRNPELRGLLWPYLGDAGIIRCKTGVRAFLAGGCTSTLVNHASAIEPQYTYAMNALLCWPFTTASSSSDSFPDKVDARTIRRVEVRRESQVARSPSDVFSFGEENAWAINIRGSQPPFRSSPGRMRAARYDLSGDYGAGKDTDGGGGRGAILLGSMRIETTYELVLPAGTLANHGGERIGDAFATYHRPRKGDMNTGHSYVSMLDGHVRQITVSDQLRRSRQSPELSESKLGPGGNLHLAWPLTVPPPGGWQNQ